LGSRRRRSDIHIDLSRAGDFALRLTLRVTTISRPAISLAAFILSKPALHGQAARARVNSRTPSLMVRPCLYAVRVYSSRITKLENMTAHARKRNPFATAAALFAVSLVLGGCRSDRVERREPDIQLESKLTRMTLQEPDDGRCDEAGPRKSLGPNETMFYILCGHMAYQGTHDEVETQFYRDLLEQGRALAAKETLARGYTLFRLFLVGKSTPGTVSIIPFLPMDFPAPPEGKTGYVFRFVMYHDRDQATHPLADFGCLWNSGGCLYDARQIVSAGTKKL
jgi:hypothetical protein